MAISKNPIHRLNLVLIASICIGEALIMLLLPYLGSLPDWMIVFLDVSLLLFIAIPVIGWTVTKPMTEYLNTITVRENQMLSTLNSLAFAKDDETGSHIMRTQQYVGLLALQIKASGHHLDLLTDEYIDLLVKVSPLHDLGKVGIPDHILKKEGKLSEEEKLLICSHALTGESILATAQVGEGEMDLIQTAMKVAGGHHEKWDGTGYPRGLKGADIPLEARIMSVADVFDALVSDRPYKKG